MTMPKDATLNQRCAPREGARGDRHLRFSVRDLTFVTSPMRRPRMPRKPRRPSATSPRSASSSPRGRETQADNRIISIRVHSTALQTRTVQSRRSSPSVSSKSSQRREGCSHRTLLRRSFYRLHSSIGQTAEAEARSDGEDRSLASGSCARIGRASPTTMGPQYRRLAIHDSWTHQLEPGTAREANVR